MHAQKKIKEKYHGNVCHLSINIMKKKKKKKKMRILNVSKEKKRFLRKVYMKEDRNLQ